MKLVVVTDDPGECRFTAPGVALLPARSYLMDAAWRNARDVRVLNLCRSCGYQRYGYYVSLLAEARGHRPLPNVDLVKDYSRPAPARLAVAAVQRCLERRSTTSGFELAILRDRDSVCPASNAEAIANFENAARKLGIRPTVIGRDDIRRLVEFDSLFIRDNTYVRHYTYRFSRRAANAGLTVIDDPDSILRCNNKVYLAELLSRHGVPIPRTLIVDRENVNEFLPTFGLPCILKRPDSSLCKGVARIESHDQLFAVAASMLAESDLIVAQEYLPTAFDWRVGVLDGKPLFVCKYHMVPGHWQILRHVEDGRYEEGRTEALRIDEAPGAVIALALRAAGLIGRGFYGIDLKQIAPNDFLVIEVNDNPNVDAGNEDGVLKVDLYMEVMSVFARRMAQRRHRRT